MALLLKPSCEQCNRELPADSDQAMICSYECTFCQDCVEAILLNVCPNCGGGFQPRPIRPQQAWREGVSLIEQPASTQRVLKPVEVARHAEFAQAIRQIPPRRR